MKVVIDEGAWQRTPPTRRAFVERAAARLRNRPHSGARIRRGRFPSAFTALPNLYRYPLPDGWRMLYTIATAPGRSGELRILWVGDHRSYDRMFGYK